MNHGPMSSRVRGFLERVVDKRRGPVVYVFRTTGFFWLAGFVPFLFVSLIGPLAPNPPDDHPPSVAVVAALVTAPLFENFCMVIIVEFTKLFDTRRPVTVAMWAVGVPAGAIHLLRGPFNGVWAGVMFALMAYSYLAWSELPVAGRYLLTVSQHFLANAPVAVLIAVLAMQ